MNLNYNMSKLLVILGPTATGKTKFAVKLSSIYNGEIISADSRQIYKGMNIGTGKDLDEYNYNNKIIPYYLIDILNPEKNYSVFQFKNDFFKSYDIINKNNNLPILCGGTGFYIESVLLNYDMPHVGPNEILRKDYEKKNIDELINILVTLDETMYDKEFHVTKRRIIRTIEIISSNYKKQNTSQRNIDNPLIIGLQLERSEVLEKIKLRLHQRLSSGMIEEVKALINKGMTFERLKYFGLEYKFIGKYLFNEIDYDTMVEKLNFAINQFSKRQMSFFRRMEKRGLTIHWISPKDDTLARELIDNYL